MHQAWSWWRWAQCWRRRADAVPRPGEAAVSPVAAAGEASPTAPRPHLRKQYRQARLRLLEGAMFYTLEVVLVTCVVMAVLHMRNIYPEKLVVHTDLQREAQAFMRFCEERVVERWVGDKCDLARRHAVGNTRLLALESTLHEFLGHLNLLRYITPSADSKLGFVLLSALNGLLSSTVLILSVVALVAVVLVVSWLRGPAQAYRQVQSLRERMRCEVPLVVFPEGGEVIETTQRGTQDLRRVGPRAQVEGEPDPQRQWV